MQQARGDAAGGSQKGQGGGGDPEVTWEDQRSINAFGRLNHRLHDLQQEIRMKKEEAENVEDASSEIVLCDDDEQLRVQSGEVFIRLGKESVDTHLDALKARIAEELAVLESERESTLAQMAELKRLLYGKFRDAINLEED